MRINPEKALADFETKLEHMPGVNVFIENTAVQTTEFIGTPGQHDVFIFDDSVKVVNDSILRNFTPGEDYIVFANMGGSELAVNAIDSNQGSFGVLFNGNGTSAAILMFGVPYDQDVLHHTILGINDLVFVSPFDIG
jgi:hypothetical protein